VTKNSIDWSEFLKNRDGKESADRLLLLISFLPATIIAAKICTVEALGVYLAAYGALAANNKWADKNASSSVDVEKLEADSDSDTVSASTVTNTVVAKRRTQTTGRRKRPF
jgi:hypothetical protein